MLKKAYLRSDINDDSKANHSVKIQDLIILGTICAIAADAKSPDTLWFVKIISEQLTAAPSDPDDYGDKIIGESNYFIGHFWEKVSEKKNSSVY